MPEYIERKALFKRLKEGTHDYDAVGKYKEGIIKGLNIAKSIVNDKARTPTADVVEVVRCKDCKMATEDILLEGFYLCEKDLMLYGADHFCNYGERKEE